MKRRNRILEVFSVSFLDVISCGFGAVVILILISKTNVDVSVASNEEVSALLSSMVSLQSSVTKIEQDIRDDLVILKQLSVKKSSIVSASTALETELAQLKANNTNMADSLEGLSLVEEKLKQASLVAPRKPINQRDDEVGGIPVDSDYVVFIVDTSGSMKRIWGNVTKEVVNVLNIHPKVKGFQILNDMGKSLISSYEGQWIPDTPVRRKAVISMFRKWNAVSNSSPVEGLSIALRRYAKPNISTSIYVFGDDYSQNGYDDVIKTVTKQNKVLSTGKRLARIHAVGFISPGTTERFSVLMREMTKQNEGTFIALPQ